MAGVKYESGAANILQLVCGALKESDTPLPADPLSSESGFPEQKRCTLALADMKI